MRSECLGIINLENKRNITIGQLTDSRPVASIPIAGRYRIIDFILSNMVNSGINNVAIFSKEKYRSLTDHLTSGKSWGLNRKRGGLHIYSPENTKNKSTYAYRTGDIYTIFSNIDTIEKSEEEYVIIAPSYMICNINYKKAYKYHKNSKNDITVIYKPIEDADLNFKSAMTLTIEKDKVIKMGTNVGAHKKNNISMETYIMKREKFIEYIYECITSGEYSYFEDFILNSINNLEIGAYEYTGYLKCVNSLKSYFDINKEILNEKVSLELLYSDRKIFTKEQSQTPTIYKEGSVVENSCIASGCIIEGTIKNSIIFRKVHVKPGTVIENSIIMKGSIIGEDVKFDNVILDKSVLVSRGKELKGDENCPIVIEKEMSI